MLIGTISPEGFVPAKEGIIYWDKTRRAQWVKEEGEDEFGWHEQYASAEET